MSDDGSEPWVPPAIVKFGDNELVNACNDKDLARTKTLVETGETVTIDTILAASYVGDAEILEFLLSVKSDPNGRIATADENHLDVDSAWNTSDLSPILGLDKREWYPIQHAANVWGKAASSACIRVLLKRGADLFRTFKQPAWKNDPYPFAGEGWRTHYTEDEYEELSDWIDGEWQRKPNPECGYGRGCVLHSLLEDGVFVEPLINNPDLHLYLEHRDPQGRTLIHAACRSAVGADAFPDAISADVHMPRFNQGLKAPNDCKSSIFHILRNRGADLMAVDYNGKHILHHLLEAHCLDPCYRRLPMIWNAFRYVLEHHSNLVNQPDKHGTYPLHSALQRLRGHVSENSVFYSDAPLELTVEALLDVGGDVKALDSRGNTVLHYLADNGLAEQWRAKAARKLCKLFCDAGGDINCRNHQGQRALMLLFDDDGARCEKLWSVNVGLRHANEPPSLEEVDKEVFDMLDRAGASWKDIDPGGGTLLHLVARHSAFHAKLKTPFRLEYLLSKGLDPAWRDNNGRTALDLARVSDNDKAIHVLGYYSV